MTKSPKFNLMEGSSKQNIFKPQFNRTGIGSRLKVSWQLPQTCAPKTLKSAATLSAATSCLVLTLQGHKQSSGLMAKTQP